MLVRRSSWRAVAAAALAGALVAGATACGDADSSGSTATGSTATSGAGGTQTTAAAGDAGKKVDLAMFLVATANTHQQAALKGAQKAVAEDGNATLHPFNGNFDPATQVKQIEDAAATGQYNAFLVDSVDGTQTVPAITKALGDDITVVCGFTICGTDQTSFKKALPVAAQVSMNYAPVGEKAAKIVSDACAGKDPCNVVYLQGVSVLAAEQVFTKAFEAGLKSTAPNVKIVAKPQGQYDPNASYEAMKPVIQANPDIDVVIAVGDQEAAGAERAIDESPLKGKVKIIGSGASTVAKQKVQAGDWYASAILRPFNEGYLEAKYAIAAARGKPLSPDVVDTGPAEGFPDGFITKDNAADWKPEWAG